MEIDIKDKETFFQEYNESLLISIHIMIYGKDRAADG
jgi:hypothetical protein